MRSFILPYRRGSKSVRELRDLLPGLRRIKLEGSRYRPRPLDVVINWGNTNPTCLLPGTLLNHPEAILEVSNKKTFFELMEDKDFDVIPDFWTSADDIPDDAYPVCCRTVLAGHSGEGIVIANSPDEVVPARLYVKYVKKKHEYRVHIGSGDVLDIQQKRKRNGVEDANFQIRNLANGFVYAREDVNPPDCVVDVAVRSFVSTSLDFGAVDVIYNEYQDRAYVLEINTAPGITGTTAQSYADFFRYWL